MYLYYLASTCSSNRLPHVASTVFANTITTVTSRIGSYFRLQRVIDLHCRAVSLAGISISRSASTAIAVWPFSLS